MGLWVLHAENSVWKYIASNGSKGNQRKEKWMNEKKLWTDWETLWYTHVCRTSFNTVTRKKKLGIVVNERISSVRYADDAVIFVGSINDLQEMLNGLNEIREKNDLKINLKNKWMMLDRDKNAENGIIKINGE